MTGRYIYVKPASITNPSRVLVLSGWCLKYQPVFVTVLEAEKPQIKEAAQWLSGKARFLTHRQSPLCVLSDRGGSHPGSPLLEH